MCLKAFKYAVTLKPVYFLLLILGANTVMDNSHPENFPPKNLHPTQFKFPGVGRDKCFGWKLSGVKLVEVVFIQKTGIVYRGGRGCLG